MFTHSFTKKTILPALIITVMFYACDSGKEPVVTDDATYHINVPLKKGNTQLPLSAVADSLLYIPLETQDDALIGQIDKLIPLKDHLIVVDKEKSRSIYFYDLQGRLLRKIKRLGRSAQEYISLTDAAADPENERIFIWDSHGQKILQYAFDGTFITSTPFPCSVHSIAYTGNNTLVGYCGYTQNTQFLKQSQYPNLLFLDLQSGDIHPACYFEEGLAASNIMGVINNFSIDPEGGATILMPLNNIVYRAEGDEIYPKYYFDFGEEQHKILQQYIDELLNYPTDVYRSVEEFNEASACFIMNFLATRDVVYIFFKKSQTYYYGFYYPKNNQFIEASIVDENSNGSRIPMTNDLDGCALPFMPIAADKENHFYYTIDPYLLDYFKDTEDQKLLHLMQQVTPNSNPIVVKVSMKTE